VPELPEVEAYRRLAERAALGRRIAGVLVPDPHVLRATSAGALAERLVGGQLLRARRRGKLLVLDTDRGCRLGLRFGMTGRLHVDGVPGVGPLLHAPAALASRWERFGVLFADGGRLGVCDPRRLGWVEVNPDEGALGPDALHVEDAELDAALGVGAVALKARLLDQARLAGVGNLVADEVLWRAGLDPSRPTGSLTSAERRRLARTLRATLAELVERGGSHMGDLVAHRRSAGTCPRDGAPLRRAAVGGRTTWWCPRHQRSGTARSVPGPEGDPPTAAGSADVREAGVGDDEE
jgi:formamidopyrimidine-DNA glycosylase